MSNDTKVKILQMVVYLLSIITLFMFFDLKLFIISLIVGWIWFGLGVSVSLHKLSSHATFKPKNRVIKWIILWFGTISSLGSSICWAAGHREHHRHADKNTDPHRPYGNLWHKIKTWFFYFPTWRINPMIVKDLLADQDHQFFHKHYYKIISLYVIILALIDPIYVGYFYAIPVLYTLTGISVITVISHIPQLGYLSWRTYDTDDYTYNSNFWNIVLIGEGYHNTHHACPWLWNNCTKQGDWDLSAMLIRLIGIPNNVPASDHPKERYGSELVSEFNNVKIRLKRDGHEL